MVRVVVRRPQRDSQIPRQPDALGKRRRAALAAGVARRLDVGLVGPDQRDRVQQPARRRERRQCRYSVADDDVERRLGVGQHGRQPRGVGVVRRVGVEKRLRDSAAAPGAGVREAVRPVVPQIEADLETKRRGDEA